MIYKVKLTDSIEVVTEHTECCWSRVWIVNGKERLQAYQGFFYASKPIYSRISSCGDRIEISEPEFRQRLDAILN